MSSKAMGTTRKRLVKATALASLAATLTGWGAVTAASPAGASSVSIDAPGAPQAGVVGLTGTASADPAGTTSVLYVVDATRSTGQVAGLDCAGDGVAGGPEDDLNRDGSSGDLLDCEISGVKALNRSLAATSRTQAGIVAFADQAASASLDPTGPVTFVPPAYTGGDAQSRIDTVVGSVVRDRIGLYEAKDLGGSGTGTAFSSAVSTALGTLASAPAGPKWIMFLSDGESGIDDSVLASLASSGVKLRSFAVGSGASCRTYGSLYKLAAATGETCHEVGDPTTLAAGLTATQPDSVSGVTVTIGDVAVAATVDAVGGWKAGFTLGQGTYVARVRATFASGVVRSTQRTFTVSSGSGPDAGTVAPAPGSLRATVVEVDQPKPTRSVLPARVTGRVGRPVQGLVTTRVLSGARVLLQTRAAAGAEWRTVAADRVSRKGRFNLRWKPKVAGLQLRVLLEPPTGYAGSSSGVPTPTISACKVKGPGKAWTLTCRTTAKPRSVVRLLDGAAVVDTARVRRGTFRLHGTGPVGGHKVELALGKRRLVRLKL